MIAAYFGAIALEYLLFAYFERSYDKGEPIFLDELPCISKEALRQEMKALIDAGKLIRLYSRNK